MSSHIPGDNHAGNSLSTVPSDVASEPVLSSGNNGPSIAGPISQSLDANNAAVIVTDPHLVIEKTEPPEPKCSSSIDQATDVDNDVAHDFSHIYTPAPALASSRYNRQMLIPAVSVSGQQRILAAKVLIIGLGGLGSPAALYLAGAGIGTLGLLDNDMVELSNLHRQVVHREDSVARSLSKVESAARGCRDLNNEIDLVQHEMRLSMDDGDRGAREAIVDIVAKYDFVLDCTDNPATRYLVSDLCVLLGKTLVSGAAQKLEGQVMVLNYEVLAVANGVGGGTDGGQSGTLSLDMRVRGPCYRCVFPTPPAPEMVRSCGEIGILGPVVGTIGTLMATETLRLIVKGAEEVRKPTMLLYNAWPVDPRSVFRTIGLRGRRKDCLACGDEAVLVEKGLRKITKEEILEGRLDYIAFCGLLEDVKLLTAEQRITAADFLHIQQTKRSGRGTSEKCRNPIVVDTREPFEAEMGSKIAKSVNIPLTRILRQNGSIQEIESLLVDGFHDSLLFVCQKGNDSQIAAQKVLNMKKKRVEDGQKEESTNNINVDNVSAPTFFIGDVVGGFVALEKAMKASPTASRPL